MVSLADPKKGTMKTRNLILGIAGLVVAAGCAMQVRNGQPDPHTKYIVKFGKPTLLTSTAGFTTALKNASWRRDINFRPPQGNDPTPDHDASPIASAVTNTLPVEQDSQINPNSQHVTQRVGFNRGQEKSLEELLEFVKQ